MYSVLHSFAIIPFNLVIRLCYFKFKSHHIKGFCKPCVNNELFTRNFRISLNLKESLWLCDRKLVNEYSEVRQHILTHSIINFNAPAWAGQRGGSCWVRSLQNCCSWRLQFSPLCSKVANIKGVPIKYAVVQFYIQGTSLFLTDFTVFLFRIHSSYLCHL